MKRFMRSKKGIAALLATLVVAAAAAVGAYAYFTSTGHGTGTASVGSVSATGALNVAVSGPTGAASLFPTALGDTNASIQTFDYAVTNPTESDVFLKEVDIAVDPGSLPAGCTTSDFSLNGGPVGAGVTDTWNNNLKPASDAPANEQDGSVTIQMVDNGGNQDACEGAAPSLTFDATS